jgi:hypothetical protein
MVLIGVYVEYKTLTTGIFYTNYNYILVL